jgi:hypothetical protein
MTQKKVVRADERKQQREALIVSIFYEHRRRYGVRRIIAELKARGSAASVYTVRKVLSDNGLKAIQPRSFVPRTTDSLHRYAISPNLLLDRAFAVRPKVKSGWVISLISLWQTVGFYTWRYGWICFPEQ